MEGERLTVLLLSFQLLVGVQYLVAILLLLLIKWRENSHFLLLFPVSGATVIKAVSSQVFMVLLLFNFSSLCSDSLPSCSHSFNLSTSFNTEYLKEELK